MNNTFNVCTACGTANPLSAKYCFQCGGQLKVPEEPIACPKCKTVNNGLAVFCRKCGTELKQVEVTKKCPKCNRELPLDQKSCQCGYKYTNSDKDASVTVKSKRASKADKGGRLFAFVTLLFILAFVTLTALPYKWSFMAKVSMVEGNNFYAMGMIMVKAILANTYKAWTLSEWMLYSMVTVLALSVVIHLLVALVRLFTGKRSTKANWIYLLLTIFTGVAAALLFLAKVPAVMNVLKFLSAFVVYFTPAVGQPIIATGPGLLVLAIPAYFFVMFIGSLIARKHERKFKTK